MTPPRYPCLALRRELKTTPTPPTTPCHVALHWWLAWRLHQATLEYMNSAYTPDRRRVARDRVRVLRTLLKDSGLHVPEGSAPLPWLGVLREFDEQDKAERDGMLNAAFKTAWAVYLFQVCTIEIATLSADLEDGEDYSGTCLALHGVAAEINRVWSGLGLTLDV